MTSPTDRIDKKIAEIKERCEHSIGNCGCGSPTCSTCHLDGIGAAVFEREVRVDISWLLEELSKTREALGVARASLNKIDKSYYHMEGCDFEDTDMYTSDCPNCISIQAFTQIDEILKGKE